MKIYTLTYVFFNSKNISATIQSNNLIFTDKYDKILSTLKTQKSYILTHLADTHEFDRDDIFITYLPATPGATKGLSIKAKDLVYMLLVDTIIAEKPLEQDANLQPGDFVTIRHEALEALNTNASNCAGFRPDRIKILKIISIKGTEALVQAQGVTNDNLQSTDYMGQRYNMPKAWLKRLYI